MIVHPVYEIALTGLVPLSYTTSTVFTENNYHSLQFKYSLIVRPLVTYNIIDIIYHTM